MKRILYLLVLSAVFTLSVNAQSSSNTAYHYQLTSHILDLVNGKPAPGVKVLLEKEMFNGKEWIFVDEKITDKDGRISDFLKVEDGKETINNGVYRLTFYTNPYFKNLNLSTFYPFIQVVFELNGDHHYHVPITLSPYGYSTYRGS